MLDDDRLVCRMGTLAHRPHAVQRGDSKGSGEVSVGAATGRGLLKIEAELSG